MSHISLAASRLSLWRMHLFIDASPRLDRGAQLPPRPLMNRALELDPTVKPWEGEYSERGNALTVCEPPQMHPHALTSDLQIRRDFRERHENEGPLGQAGVG